MMEIYHHVPSRIATGMKFKVGIACLHAIRDIVGITKRRYHPRAIIARLISHVVSFVHYDLY